MDHLEFCDELEKSGIRIFSTNKEGIVREYKVDGLFENKTIVADKFKLSWKENKFMQDSPFEALIRKAIDMDDWKNSWHITIIPENYDKIENIIQQKIINRVKEIDELMSIYFQLNHEKSKIVDK
jgi:hypothetical protein